MNLQEIMDSLAERLEPDAHRVWEGTARADRVEMAVSIHRRAPYMSGEDAAIAEMAAQLNAEAQQTLAELGADES